MKGRKRPRSISLYLGQTGRGRKEGEKKTRYDFLRNVVAKDESWIAFRGIDFSAKSGPLRRG